MIHKGEKTIFKCKTLEGHILKSLFELLQNHYKLVYFNTTDDKLVLRQIDNSGLIIFDIELISSNFASYWVQKDLVIAVYVDHLYKIIKNCKKNDSIVLIILENKPEMLYIEIQKDNTTCSNANLPLQVTQIESITLPLLPSYPCTINLSTKDFFKLMKDNISISDKCLFDFFENCVHITSDNSGMYTKKIKLGDLETENTQTKITSQRFYTYYLNKLSKFSVLSHMFTLHAAENTPLYLSVNIGHIGKLKIFIKSIEIENNNFI